MITIEGKSLKAGVAIAVAAVIDAQHGLGGVSPALMGNGMRALRAMLAPRDCPEAVVACDVLAMGISLKVPGVATIGIAAESEADVPGLEPEVPCVIGLPNLLKSISQGDILIVDGNKGVVHIDPDLETLVHYQEMEERAAAASMVYVAAEHLPARTQEGETVRVFAHVASEGDLVTALDQGADGVIVEAEGWESETQDVFSMVLHTAAGKRIAFATETSTEEVLRAVMLYGAPHQVTLLFAAELFDPLVAETQSFVELVTADALLNDLNPPQVEFGIRVRDVEMPRIEVEGEPSLALVDVRKSPSIDASEADLAELVARWTDGMPRDCVVLMLGRRINAVPRVVEAGARAIAVEPELVSAAKLAIRSIGDVGDEP